MIQIIRRTSTSQHRQDPLEFITQKIIKHKKSQRRQSINPLPQGDFFPILKEQNITNEFLQSTLNHIEKRVAVVGIILPKQLLLECCQFLVQQTIGVQNKGLLGIWIDQEQQWQAKILMLFLQEQKCLQGRIEQQERVLYGLSMVWIVTETFMRKRWHLWQFRQELFNKQSSLFILKEGHPVLSQDVIEKLGTLFWSVEVFSLNEVHRRGPKFNPNFLAPSRQAYNELAEQQQNSSSVMKDKLRQLAKVSLKNNYRFSCSLLCLPFIYGLATWIREQQRGRKQLIEISISNYFKMLEEEFTTYLYSLKLPADELKLRNIVGNQKKIYLRSIHKHIAMLEGIFPKSESMQKYVESMARFLRERQNALYQQNQKEATLFNQNLLAKLYSELIEKKFQDCQSERTLRDYQSDFQAFLDCYGAESIRVASQLKTFNQFIMERKISYAQNLQKELQNSKRRFTAEKDELRDRLDIQAGVLQTLEEEIRQLESRRQSIESDNSDLKKTIGKIRQRSSRQSVSNSPLLPRRRPVSISNQEAFRQSRPLAKVGKSRRSVQDDKKGRCSCCCCSVM